MLTFHLKLLGSEGVGKTMLVMRYCENKYIDQYVRTIGMDFRIKKLKYAKGNKISYD